MSYLPIQLGFRFCQQNGQSGFTRFIGRSSVLGIALGVMVLIICLSAMNGFEQALRDRVLSVIPQGSLQASNAPLKNWPKLQKILASQPGIEAVAPEIKLSGLLQRGGKLKAVQIRAVQPADEQHLNDAARYMTQGGWSVLKPGSRDLILGSGVAHKLDLRVGDYVSMLLPQSKGTKGILSPKTERFKVVALLSIGGQLDNYLGYIHLKDAQQVLGWGDGIGGFTLRVDQIFNASTLIRGAGMSLDIPLYASSWMSEQGYLYQDIQMVRTILYLLMVLLVAVACFNIVSTLVMAVNDKRSEIAILRTLGMSQWQLRSIFMVLGVSNGVLGGALGCAFGVLVALNLTALSNALQGILGHRLLNPDIYFIDFIPSHLELRDVLVVVGTVLLMSLLATLYPAWLASRVEPAKELGRA